MKGWKWEQVSKRKNLGSERHVQVFGYLTPRFLSRLGEFSLTLAEFREVVNMQLRQHETKQDFDGKLLCTTWIHSVSFSLFTFGFLNIHNYVRWGGNNNLLRLAKYQFVSRTMYIKVSQVSQRFKRSRK